MKHSKGKWIIDYGGTLGHIKAVSEETPESTPTVCIYNIFTKYGGEIANKHMTEEIANAKLIAMAPELLECLKEAIEFHKEIDNSAPIKWVNTIDKATK